MKEWRSYSYARPNKIFPINPKTSEGVRQFMNHPGLSPVMKKGSFRLPSLVPKLKWQLLVHAVFLAEFLNAASGVHDLLLTRIERVALGANLDMQVFAVGGASLERVAAAACNVDFCVVWVNVRFHAVILARSDS